MQKVVGSSPIIRSSEAPARTGVLFARRHAQARRAADYQPLVSLRRRHGRARERAAPSAPPTSASPPTATTARSERDAEPLGDRRARHPLRVHSPRLLLALRRMLAPRPPGSVERLAVGRSARA